MKASRPEVVAGLALGVQLALHHHLGGDAGVVGARLPEGALALHAVVADQRVHHRVLKAWPMCRLPVTLGGGIMMQ